MYTYGSGAIRSNKTLWMWGKNDHGQVGQNDRAQYSSPAQVGSDTTWAYMAHSSQSVSATKTDGTLWSWGSNGSGQLGVNDRASKSSPTQVPGTTWAVAEGKLTITSAQSFAIKTDGTLWSWGDNYYGELGQNEHDNTTNRSSPVQIPGTTWNTVSKSGYASATKTDGTLWVWGYNFGGDLGQNQPAPSHRSSPVQVPGTTWASISRGGQNSYATKTDGTLWVWGENGYGDLGQNNRTSYSSPVQVPGTTWSTKISTNGGFVMAVKTDGTLWAWGANHKGPLGQNNRTRYSSPVQVGSDATWIDVFAGGETTMYALKSS